MKVVSLNVNGIRSAYRKGFEKWLVKENPDILCLQEVKADQIPSDETSSRHLNNIYHLSINPAMKKGYSGTAIFTREKPKKIIMKLGFERFDTQGRYLEFQFDNFTLINIYMPHGSRDKKNLKYKLSSYENLLDRIKRLKDQKVILAGDFNVAHKEIDLARPKQNLKNTMFTPEERQQIEKVTEFGFIDSFRRFNLAGGNYTWWPYSKSAREKNIGWRLDYIFTSKPMESNLKSASIFKDIFLSDHCPTITEIIL